MRIHTTCVAIDGLGVLLRGPSGSGKSDLALRLIDGGGQLVSDDYTDIEERHGEFYAVAPDTIAGLMEVRGLGVLRVGNLDEVKVGLVVDLVPPGAVERLPEAATCDDYGHPLAWLRLAPFEESAAAKVRLAVRVANGDIRRADE